MAEGPETADEEGPDDMNAKPDTPDVAGSSVGTESEARSAQDCTCEATCCCPKAPAAPVANHDELERLAMAAVAVVGKPDEDDWFMPEHFANLEPEDAAFIAAANPTTILALLSANREMREEPRVLAITLEGMQGEPAGMMTVGVQMTDGQKFDLIRTNGTVISHWARLPDAKARSALTTQRGGGE